MPRTHQEMTQANIELGAEFSRYLFDNPDLENRIPPDSEIIFLPQFDQDLMDFNVKLGKKLEADGNKVAYVRIEKLNPKILSRIEGVEVEFSAAI